MTASATIVPYAAVAGETVFNRDDEELGTIGHIVIDARTGRVAYAVLSHGGVCGIGGKLFAVPWKALTLDADRHCFILDASPAELESSPGFDEEYWPLAPDPRWKVPA